MNVPKNVLWFEVLLYLSLVLDALSVAFQDRTPSPEMTDQMITVASVMAGCLILLLVYFVWLAAQRRKNWPRWALVASLVLSVISLVQIVGESGVQLDSGIEIVSCALTAAGLYFSFTGDAKGWFNG
jgi:peptidoglycan biosynthesis protein MviN/MurJ (putative lipid II flippase)